jgi:hypothetical protein
VLDDPHWIDQAEMKEGDVDSLPEIGVQFWNDLINKYLFVLNKNPKVIVIISAVHFSTLNTPIY